MDIYENIVIGHFLFEVGLLIGKKAQKEALPMSTSLLQQTPYDRPLSDVYLANANFIRLFEFKRVTGDRKKERAKLTTLSLALSANERLTELSREIHFYVESELRPAQKDKNTINLCIRVAPYLDFLTSDGQRMRLEALAKTTADAAIESRMNEQKCLDCKVYVDLLLNVHGSDACAEGGLVVVATSQDEIRTLVLPSIPDLGRDLRVLHEPMQERDRGSSRAQKLNLDFDHSHERGHEIER